MYKNPQQLSHLLKVVHRFHVLGLLEDAGSRLDGLVAILSNGAAWHQQTAGNQYVKQYLAVTTVVELGARSVEVLGYGL